MELVIKEHGRMMKRMVKVFYFTKTVINTKVDIYINSIGMFQNSEKNGSGVLMYGNGDRYEG